MKDTSTTKSKGDGPPQGPGRAPFPVMHMASNFLFVMGSVLYLWLAVIDYQWSLELETLPMYVRVADDDITWANYRIQERATGAGAGVGRFLQSLNQYFNSELPGEDGDGNEQGGGNTSSIGNDTTTSTDNNASSFTSAPSLMMMESTLAPSALLQQADPSPTTSAPPIPAPISLAPTTAAPGTNTPAPSVLPVPTQPAPPTPEELYYDEYWADLPPEIQAAYAVLGYNEQLWNNAGSTAADDKAWNELTPEERQAAEFIGYTQALWDGTTLAPTGMALDDGTGGSSSSSVEPDVVEPGYYDDYYWHELPPFVQEAATLLGYDEQIWNTSGYATTENLDWEELSPEQQEAAAVLGYDQYAWNGIDPTTGESVAQDDYVSEDDDYVFHVGGGADTYVSEYQIIYFCAAFSFVFMGAFDLIREKRYFHILMIVAGLFGVASALLVEEEVRISNILNLVSVHLFLFEAFALFGNHKREAVAFTDEMGGNRKCLAVTLTVADSFFAAGALIDVILSYFYVLDDASDWQIELQITGIIGGILWLVCALVYVAATLIHWRSGEDIVVSEECNFHLQDIEVVEEVDADTLENETDDVKAGEGSDLSDKEGEWSLELKQVGTSAKEQEEQEQSIQKSIQGGSAEC